MEYTKESLVKIVQQSPEAVAIHDKAAWMSIFASNHIVEDPVGSVPHLSNPGSDKPHDALSRFYDTFIAPNQIAFDVASDSVSGLHVMRDLTINLQMSDKVSAQVPMHLLYELADDNGELKVARLAAHWEFMPMIVQLLKKGFAAVPVLASLTVRMFKLQGLGGTLGFSKAALNIGQKGKEKVLAFERAFNAKDKAALKALLADGEIAYMPESSEPMSAQAFIEQVSGHISVSKLLAAGQGVTATVQVQAGDSNVHKNGVLLVKFDKATMKINYLRFYVD